MDFDSFILAASTADLSEEPAAREHADAIEYRMDLADEPLVALEAYDDGDGELPILATNRAEWEGGEWSGDDERRLEILAEATAIGAVEAIDIELETILAGDADNVLETARERDVAVVASAHDFEGTPTRGELVSTLTEAHKHADVAKIAVTAESRKDTLAVLAATEQLTAHGDPVATMAMGELGSHTRAVAPVYGSKIGYAPVDPDNATAPGQYDLETLSRLVAELS
ncbi:type I 3-dehydroquinate dehydratase [Natronorubrum bangense]|uniref:3-dehydroquinate dehydratase n=2 Tax=Natronorubrum bangense TaxID=61858 RepID=L9WF13_9EURY|nr:type I 3-dehydroquinate dehydratase [Natronorubrum bangense]ELY47947.1 3-dehydroquinate dehydratase [Natronorubrum bangense JCM 10635]QCC53589.1 type I 3-dehydroquinate dehydratase [Natronorubrum bangense]